jgi:Methyltransferase FkbM domain
MLSRVVTLEHAFLVDDELREPIAEFYASWPLAGGAVAGVHPEHHGELKSTEGASRWTLDRYVEDKDIESIRLIKIDVDGLEWNVLKGARKTLQRFRPFIVMEVAPYILDEREGSLEGIVELLGKAGYGLTDIPSGDHLPMCADGLRAKIPRGAGINALAQPGEGAVTSLGTASNELDAPGGEEHHLQE